jgi:activating signal cointegrator 1
VRALSLWQPWASLVACGRKTIETRSWRTGYRGPLAIHASQRPPRKGECPGEVFVNGIGELSYWLPEPWTEEDQTRAGLPPDGDLVGFPLPLGAVVATCRLVDVVPMTESGRYRPGDEDYMEPHLLLSGLNGHLWLWTGETAVNVEDQRIFGDFRPGRFAWILDEIRWIPPVPARGRQGIWNWDSSPA